MRKTRKIMLKVKAMSKSDFETKKDRLKSKIAVLLKISEERIEISLVENKVNNPTSSRRLLMMPVNTLDIQTQAESEIDVVITDADSSSNEVSADGAAAALQKESVSQLSTTLGVTVDAIEVAPTATPTTAPVTNAAASTNTNASQGMALGTLVGVAIGGALGVAVIGVIIGGVVGHIKQTRREQQLLYERHTSVKSQEI
jgi:hypothetical protein